LVIDYDRDVELEKKSVRSVISGQNSGFQITRRSAAQLLQTFCSF